MAEAASVKVAARFRPLNSNELAMGSSEVVHFDGDRSVSIQSEEGEGSHGFTFDRVFSTDSTQLEVFEYAALPILEDVFQGYYATIFAYGQTGSGKTHTMEGGGGELRGIIPRCVETIFDRVASGDEEVEFTVAVSFVEIYMERIRDLLDRSRGKTNLDIRVDLQRGVYVDGATEVVVNSDREMAKLMDQGAKARQVGSTGMNEQSSRSHAIFMLTVSQKHRKDLTMKTGKLFLVDLAGSEQVGKTGAKDQRLEEAKQINKSLSALGNVIKALTDSKMNYVPYRDSKLTRLLQDSLGGGSRTCLLIAASPAAYNTPETLSTLRFGSRAKQIKNKLRVHVGYGGTEMDEVLKKREEEVAHLQEKLYKLDQETKVARETSRRYSCIYGTLPKLKESEVDVVPSVPLEEALAESTAKVEALEEEAKALRRANAEAMKLVQDVSKHLSQEKSLFGELRSKAAVLVKRALKAMGGGGGEGGAEGAEAERAGVEQEGKKVDELLGMGKFRAETLAAKLQRAERDAAAATKARAKADGIQPRNPYESGRTATAAAPPPPEPVSVEG